MLAKDEDAASVRFPPPLVYVAAIGVGITLRMVASPLQLGMAISARVAVAGSLGAAGMAILAAATSRFKRGGQDPKPWKVTPEIIRTGIYGATRNPMYVAMGLLQVSIGVALANGWIVVLAPIALAIVYAIAIRHEEAYLEAKFGDPYRNYKKSVRRWL
ncbi:MAG: isoprenylcysteine carboxylmethyltransferase family protein [Nannocystaceae bacterium]